MSRLLIANRGEIARRVLRAGRERGDRIAVVSVPEDRDALVRREADDVLEVESFLDGAAIVAAARAWKAELLHPGYGFLAESPDFAEAVEAAGIAFVGPTAETMRRVGNKESAKELARRCGVPTIAAVSSDELARVGPEGLAALLEARGLAPPLLVKAAAGGGGRGMRIVRAVTDLPAALDRAAKEAEAAFGDPTLFVEAFVPEARHVEVQIFGDGEGGGVFLGERECSLQRRYQKIVEEAPSVAVDGALREAMGRAAMELVRATAYRGAGTVEFLLDESGRFFFLEVNARLQVEHPVTEMVYGVDLVRAQLELAEGRWPAALGDPTVFAVPRAAGAAVEARVTAEDPRNGFLPTPGPLVRYREPAGDGLRIDTGVCEGGRVNDRFDSLVAKVIAVGRDRAEAMRRLDAALEGMVVHGCTTNLPFLQALLRHPDVRRGAVSTGWVEAHADELAAPLLPETLRRRLGTKGFRERLSLALAGGPEAPPGPAARRFAAQARSAARVGSGHEESALVLRPTDEPGRFLLGGPGLAEALVAPSPPPARFSERLRAAMARVGYGGDRVEAVLDASRVGVDRIAVTLFGETWTVDCPRHRPRAALDAATASGEIRAPMAGTVLEIHVREGDPVEEGQLAFVIESMKMQLEVHAPASGRVAKVLVEPGQVLAGPEPMALLESPPVPGRGVSPVAKTR